MDASLDTLFLPLQNGEVPAEGRVLFLGAAMHPYLRNCDADCWQPFKPVADTLGSVRVVTDLPTEKTYDVVLINIPKQVQEARHWIATGLYALKEQGWLVLSAANDANGGRLEKWLKELGLSVSSYSKNKARVVWARASGFNSALAQEWFEAGQKQKRRIGDELEVMSQPGVYGWDKVDTGSQLLTEYVPMLAGTGADFGAGTGFLSRHILMTSPDIRALYLAEADYRALECAQDNLSSVKMAGDVYYLWADLSRPVDLPPLDFIVMNPPFHVGKKTDVSVGQAFLETAYTHLKKGGHLYLVANAHLPYEDVLRLRFCSVRHLAQEKGFKVLEAIK